MNEFIEAIIAGDEGLTELFIDEGADVDKAKKTGTTPLWIAVFMGHKEIVEKWS